MTKLRANSRKKDCQSCGAKTGSRHKRKCLYAYVPELDSKSRPNLLIRDKIKIILGVLRD